MNNENRLTIVEVDGKALIFNGFYVSKCISDTLNANVMCQVNGALAKELIAIYNNSTRYVRYWDGSFKIFGKSKEDFDNKLISIIEEKDDEINKLRSMLDTSHDNYAKLKKELKKLKEQKSIKHIFSIFKNE